MACCLLGKVGSLGGIDSFLTCGYGDGVRCRSLLLEAKVLPGLNSSGTKAIRWEELLEACECPPGDVTPFTVTLGMSWGAAPLCFLLPELSCLFRLAAALDGIKGLQPNT